MADPMKIRAAEKDGVVTVRALMAHEMETGQRKDSSGAVIPAWFIQEVVAKSGGNVVMTAQWGPAVSKNPYLQFGFKGGKKGDTVSITWTDNKGDTRTDEAKVS